MVYMILAICLVIVAGIVSLIVAYFTTHIKHTPRIYSEKLIDNEIPLSEAMKELKLVNSSNSQDNK